jgi:hypothetical protein
MKIRIIICLFTVYCNPTFSQTFGNRSNNCTNLLYLSTIEGNKKYSQDFFKNIEGSPYLLKTLCYLKL